MKCSRIAWTIAVLLCAALGRVSPAVAQESTRTPAPQGPEAAVRVLLEASRPLGEGLERSERQPAPQMPDDYERLVMEFEAAVRNAYPSDTCEALAARERLLADGAPSAAAMLAEFGRCDLATGSGLARASYADSFLAEAASGHFKFSFEAEERNVARNRRVLASWTELAARTRELPEFWSGRAGVDSATLAKLTAGLPLAFLASETVLDPKTSIRATSASGTITIAHAGGFRRAYTWEGATRVAQMEPRAERWLGSQGIYYPGPGNHWREHDGITRGVLQEGRMDFATTELALAWIETQRKWLPLVYRGDGLAVAWGKVPARNQLNVDVWQITIAGVPPAGLPGATDDALVVVNG